MLLNKTPSFTLRARRRDLGVFWCKDMPCAQVTAENVESCLPAIQTTAFTAANVEVSLSPFLWRTAEQLTVNVGLRAVQVECEQSLPLLVYSKQHPRIITTGTPLLFCPPPGSVAHLACAELDSAA